MIELNVLDYHHAKIVPKYEGGLTNSKQQDEAKKFFGIFCLGMNPGINLCPLYQKGCTGIRYEQLDDDYGKLPPTYGVAFIFINNPNEKMFDVIKSAACNPVFKETI